MVVQPASDLAAALPTLDVVLQSVGHSLLVPAAAPAGLNIPAGPPVIFDAAERPPRERQALLLLIGLKPPRPEIEVSIRAAAECGAAAVVIKVGGEPTGELIRQAHEAGVAVLIAADEAPWERIQAMLAAAVARPLSVVVVADRSAATEDLLHLADATARAAGGAVTIEDAQRTIVAYSNLDGQPIDRIRRDGILARRIPDHPLNDVQYRQLAATAGPVRFSGDAADETMARVAIAVRAGPRVLGSIWAIDAPGTTPEAVDAALREGAETAALYLLRARATADLERHGRGEHLRILIEGRDLGGASAGRLGVPPGNRFALAAFAIAGGNQEPADPRLEIEIDRFCHAFRSTTALVRLGSTVYLLIPLQRDPASGRRLASGAAEHAALALRAPVQAALSDPCQDPATIARLRRDVDAILRALRAGDDAPRLAIAEDVRLQMLLDHLADTLAAAPPLAHPGVSAAAEHDRVHGSAYVETLLARLETGDSQSAATRLSVHRNTVGYRIGQARRRFGIDLTDPDERLLLWLQLRIARAAGDSSRHGS